MQMCSAIHIFDIKTSKNANTIKLPGKCSAYTSRTGEMHVRKLALYVRKSLMHCLAQPDGQYSPRCTMYLETYHCCYGVVDLFIKKRRVSSFYRYC